MKLSEILAKEGINENEDVIDSLDLKGILNELKEIIKTNAEIQQQQQKLQQQQTVPLAKPLYTIEKKEGKEIINPYQDKPVQTPAQTNISTINKEKLKANIKAVLETYKNNPMVSSFSIKDGIEFLTSNDGYLSTAADTLIEIIEKSKD
jgi:hypothetical protein